MGTCRERHFPGSGRQCPEEGKGAKGQKGIGKKARDGEAASLGRPERLVCAALARYGRRQALVRKRARLASSPPPRKLWIGSRNRLLRYPSLFLPAAGPVLQNLPPAPRRPLPTTSLPRLMLAMTPLAPHPTPYCRLPTACPILPLRAPRPSWPASYPAPSPSSSHLAARSG